MATWSLPSITQCCLSLVCQGEVISHYRNTTFSLRCLSLLLMLRYSVRKNSLTPVAAVHILFIFYSARLASSVIYLLHDFIMNGYPISSRAHITLRATCLPCRCLFRPVYNYDLCLSCSIPWLKMALILVASNLTLNAKFLLCFSHNFASVCLIGGLTQHQNAYMCHCLANFIKKSCADVRSRNDPT